jgi:hypothetical protein
VLGRKYGMHILSSRAAIKFPSLALDVNFSRSLELSRFQRKGVRLAPIYVGNAKLSSDGRCH